MSPTEEPAVAQLRFGKSATGIACEAGNSSVFLARTPPQKCFGDVRAVYAIRQDGRLDVVNRCRTDDGVTEARGVARVVDSRTAAKLKVRFAPAVQSFLPAVWGDYWVLGLAPDYSWATVGSPDRKHLWILGRTSSIGKRRPTRRSKRRDLLSCPPRLVEQPVCPVDFEQRDQTVEQDCRIGQGAISCQSISDFATRSLPTRFRRAPGVSGKCAARSDRGCWPRSWACGLRRRRSRCAARRAP